MNDVRRIFRLRKTRAYRPKLSKPPSSWVSRSSTPTAATTVPAGFTTLPAGRQAPPVNESTKERAVEEFLRRRAPRARRPTSRKRQSSSPPLIWPRISPPGNFWLCTFA